MDYHDFFAKFKICCLTRTAFYKQNKIQNIIIIFFFFNVGPPKEDIFSGHLLSPIFQSSILHVTFLQVLALEAAQAYPYILKRDSIHCPFKPPPLLNES